MYEIWKDADGKQHWITEMDTRYIENCIKNIKRVCKEYGIKRDDPYETAYAGTYRILAYDWCVRYANGYLNAFEEELETR